MGPTPEASAVRKVAARILPFLFILYLSAFIDRVNVGFAAVNFQRDLGLSGAAYGLGTGMFFVGYFLFEVPFQPDYGADWGANVDCAHRIADMGDRLRLDDVRSHQERILPVPVSIRHR